MDRRSFLRRTAGAVVLAPLAINISSEAIAPHLPLLPTQEGWSDWYGVLLGPDLTELGLPRIPLRYDAQHQVFSNSEEYLFVAPRAMHVSYIGLVNPENVMMMWSEIASGFGRSLTVGDSLSMRGIHLGLTIS